ncbi:MAG TPA: VCBS domain-containing protein [Ramlibacter sp.]|nr:VCBS domain-containing protein [Ramlibacter sp.]
MTNAALGIRGRLEIGETLTAWAITSETSYSWQWQAWNGSAWFDVGPANSITYTIQANQVGYQFRIVATASGQTYTSLPTASATLDTKKETAPTLAPDNLAILFGPAEHVTYTGLFARATFGDIDKGNFGGGTLVVTNTNSGTNGGDGHDILGVQFGVAYGLTYDAATRDIIYSAAGSKPVAIGKIDLDLGGFGTDLKIVFNSNATMAAINAVVHRVQMSNGDDSPEHYRMLTAVLTDPTGRSAQYAIGVEITGLPDAPVFTSEATFSAPEGQTAVGVVSAIDPDREPGAAQGIVYSLASGDGSADNAYFRIDATTGALSFQATPDFEDWSHSSQYAVRVRATDSEGSVTEQAITVNVTNVNEAPISFPGFAYTYENAAPITSGVGIYDADGDAISITWDTTGIIGNLTFDGASFTYDPGTSFEYLSAYSSVTQTLSFTAVDPGGLSTTNHVDLHVFGENDAATLNGVFTATLVEDSIPGVLSAGAQVTVTDPDMGEGKLYPLYGGSGPGLLMTNNQGWSYNVSNADIQYLGVGQSVDSVATIRSWDGTATQQVTVTILGVNDAPRIGAAAYTGSVVEAGNLDNGAYVPGSPTISGGISGSDVDSGDTITWSGTANGTYGQFTINSTTGQWTYTLDNSRPATDALRENRTGSETFVVTLTDSHGASAQTSIGWQIRGTNDSPVISGNSQATGSVTEPARTGSTTFDLGGSFENEHFVALETDGGIVMLGRVADPSIGSQTALTHYGADGSRDMSYGDNGVALLDGLVSGSGMVLDAQGRALVAGYTAENYAQTQVDWAIERRNADGTPDLSFGTNGRVVIDLGGYDYTDDIFVDPAGHILVSGGGKVVRLNADGSLDATFGDGGIWDQSGYALATVDAAGRMLTVGGTYDDEGNGTIDLVRYLADGSVDASFGEAGQSSIAIGSGGIRAFELKTDGDGNITLAWSQYTDVLYYVPISVARITNSGAIDTAFGVDGIVRTTLNGGDLSLALDAQGGALVAYTPAGWDNGDLSVVRFNDEGSRDSSFGTAGVATVDRGDRDEIGTISVAASGDIVVTGNAEWGNDEDIEFAGFHADGSVDNTFGAIAPGHVVATGTLVATDVDAPPPWTGPGDVELIPAPAVWSGNAAGTYGSFTITTQGAWNYVLDVNAEALQDLDEGETATETFSATFTDSYGATASQQVVITIVGSEDPT